MARTTAYTMKNVDVTINGQSVFGFWDGDDAVTVEQLEDVGTMLIGADGDGLFSQHTNEGARITVRLQHTSPAHRMLMQELARQRAAQTRLSGFPVHVNDLDSNEGGSTATAFIQSAPSDAKGKTAGPREWVMVTASWRPNIPDIL